MGRRSGQHVQELRVRDGAPVRPACAGAESACQGTQRAQVRRVQKASNGQAIVSHGE